MYNQRFTESERELKSIEKLETNEFELNIEDETSISDEKSFNNIFLTNNVRQVCLYPDTTKNKKSVIPIINVNQTTFKVFNEIVENEGY